MFEATPAEREAIVALLDRARDHVSHKHAPSGYNISIDEGTVGREAAIVHLHVHLIPRYSSESGKNERRPAPADSRTGCLKAVSGSEAFVKGGRASFARAHATLPVYRDSTQDLRPMRTALLLLDWIVKSIVRCIGGLTPVDVPGAIRAAVQRRVAGFQRKYCAAVVIAIYVASGIAVAQPRNIVTHPRPRYRRRDGDHFGNAVFRVRDCKDLDRVWQRLRRPGDAECIGGGGTVGTKDSRP